MDTLIQNLLSPTPNFIFQICCSLSRTYNHNPYRSSQGHPKKNVNLNNEQVNMYVQSKWKHCKSADLLHSIVFEPGLSGNLAMEWRVKVAVNYLLKGCELCNVGEWILYLEVWIVQMMCEFCREVWIQQRCMKFWECEFWKGVWIL